MSILQPSRAVVALVALAASLGCMIFYAQAQTPVVLSVALLEGLIQLAYFAGCWLIGWPIARRLLNGNTHAGLRFATTSLLGFGLLGIVALLLGLAGWLNAMTIWALFLLGAITSLVGGRPELQRLWKEPLGLPNWHEKSAGGWLWVLMAFLVTIPLIGATLPPGFLWRPEDPHPYDALIYHLQVPREWFEAGKIIPLEHNAYSYFPFNLEIHYLIANHLRVGAYPAMYQAQFFSLSLTLLAALALWGWVRQRAGGLAAAISAAALLVVPWILMLACIAYNESTLLCFGILGLIWFVDGLQQEHRRRSFLLAGIFCGLASGTKLTAVPMLLLGIPLAGILAALADWPTFKRATVGGLLTGVIGLAVLSPWLIRNQVWAGNPVFPMAARQLGSAHFTPDQMERWERAHAPATDHQRWDVRCSRTYQQIALNWRFGYLVFPLAIAAALFAWKSVQARTALLLIILMLLFWLTTTHLMGRFFVLALAPAGMLVGMLPSGWLKTCRWAIAVAGICCFLGTNPALDGSESRNLHQLLARHAEAGRQGLFALPEYSAIYPPELGTMLDKTGEIVLVGDGQVFWYRAANGTLRFRTVFDLVNDGRDPLDVWYGPPPARCPPEANVIIDSAECQRLSKTYWKVPMVNPPAEGRFRSLLVR